MTALMGASAAHAADPAGKLSGVGEFALDDHKASKSIKSRQDVKREVATMSPEEKKRLKESNIGAK